MALCWLLCWLLLAGVGLFWRGSSWQVALDVGNPAAEGPFLAAGRTAAVHNFFGIHPPEQAQDGSARRFRWTSAEQTTLTFPAAQRMQPLILSVTVCGCRSTSEPAPLTLALNNRPLVTTAAANQWRRYHLLVPPNLPHPDYSLMLALHSPTWQAADGRTVGVALDRVGLRQAENPPLLTPLELALLLATGGVLLALRRQEALPAVVLLLAGGLLLSLHYTPHLLNRWQVLVLVAGNWLLLAWLAGRISPGRWLAALLPVVLAGWLLLSAHLLGRWILDDAYISFRYAQHLVQGHGLVFNPGERVEGYTNFLWTLLVAGGLWAGGDPVLLTTMLTTLLGGVLLAGCIALAHRLTAQPVWAWSAGVVLALSTPFLLYTSRGSGMETALFAACIALALLALSDQRWWLAGLLAALTMLTRPDGLLLAGVGGLFVLWQSWRGAAALRENGGRWWPVARYSLPLLLLYLPYYGWRFAYYGYPLPNTFYAKVGSDSEQLRIGLGYLWKFAREDLLLLALVPALLLALRWGRWLPEQRPTLALLGGFCAAFGGYVVLVGGDWMPGARFWVALLVPLVALLVAALAALARAAPRLLPLSGALLVLLLVGQSLRLPATSARQPGNLVWNEVVVVQRYREVGRWIDQHTPPDTLIAAAAAGAMPYYAQRPTVDVLGLNDAYIAHLPVADERIDKPGHRKTDAAYVLGRRPALIPWITAPYVSEHPDFAANYHHEKFIGPEGTTVRLFVRNDYRLPPE